MTLKAVLPTAFARHVRTARELADERRRAPEVTRIATALPAFDRLLEGGLERGAMVELIGHRSSGRFALVLTALAAATAAGEAAALVDLGDGLAPRDAAAAGIELERLLWVRPRHVKELLASAEVILASGMPLVVLDLGMPPIPGGRGVEAAWLRLARSARARGAALFISSPYRVSGTAAQAVFEARRPRAGWVGASPRLLSGVASEVELVKCRQARRQGAVESLDWRVAAAVVDGPAGLEPAELETVDVRERAIA